MDQKKISEELQKVADMFALHGNKKEQHFLYLHAYMPEGEEEAETSGLVAGDKHSVIFHLAKAMYQDERFEEIIKHAMITFSHLKNGNKNVS